MCLGWILTNSCLVVIDDAGWHSRRRRRSRGAPTTASKEVVYRNTRRLNPVDLDFSPSIDNYGGELR